MRLEIHQRNYSHYEWIFPNDKTDTKDLDTKKSEKNPDPIQQKLFHGDSYDWESGCVNYDSPIRQKGVKIPGVLILEGNRTYGRQICTGKKSGKGRLYYRCIPNDFRYPLFLIPYEPPVEFSKHSVNLFVLFEFTEWTQGFAPYGKLVATVGKVNELPSYYEYLLHCRGLSFEHHSQLNQKIRKQLLLTAGISVPETVRSDNGKRPFIFSIDPVGSRDLDDAFSIHLETDGGMEKTIVRVYISNMVEWADRLGLWEDLSLQKTGANTLYLPDRNRPMIPGIISDQKASLIADGEVRPVIVGEWTFTSSRDLENMRFYTDAVVIDSNERYDTEKLERLKEYQNLLEWTRQWAEGDGFEESVEDSHTLVAFWMVEYNREMGQRLAEKETGIFRVCSGMSDDKARSETGDKEWNQVLKYWKSDLQGEYRPYSALMSEMRHEGIAWKRGETTVYYVHSSSPIRRLVDIYNQCGLFGFSEASRLFCERLWKQMDELNRQTLESKRVQRESEMIAAFFSCPNISENEYVGLVIDKDERGIWVYLKEWKRIVLVLSELPQTNKAEEEWFIGMEKKCQIFLFEEEEKSYKKIAVRFLPTPP